MSYMHKTLRRIRTWYSRRKTHLKSKKFDKLSVIRVFNGSSERKSWRSKRFLKLSEMIDPSEFKLFCFSKLDELPTKVVDENCNENKFIYKTTPLGENDDGDTKSLSK